MIYYNVLERMSSSSLDAAIFSNTLSLCLYRVEFSGFTFFTWAGCRLGRLRRWGMMMMMGDDDDDHDRRRW